MTDNAKRALDPVGWLIEFVRKFGLETLFRRYYGVYRGVVIDNEDPEKRLRVRVQVPAVGHFSKDLVPDDVYAEPCMNGLSVGERGGQLHGVFAPPEVGDQVWVMFEGGRPNSPLYLGGWIPKNDPQGRRLIHDDKPSAYRGMRTKAGHFIRLSDDEDDLHILIAKGDGSGGENGTLIGLDNDDNATVATKHGSMVFLTDEGATLVAPDGSMVTAGDGAVTLTTKDGDFLTIDDGNCTISAKDVKIKASGQISLDGKVLLGPGPAYEPAVMGRTASILLNTHVHTSSAPSSPTSPPNGAPIVQKNGLSTNVKVS